MSNLSLLKLPDYMCAPNKVVEEGMKSCGGAELSTAIVGDAQCLKYTQSMLHML